MESEASSPTNPQGQGGAECQRYYAIGKKIPKDVKRYCGMCRQHGIMLETRGHVCNFKSCECAKCLLVRQRRRIMSTQIRLRRAQDKRFQRTSSPSEADVVPLRSSGEAAAAVPKEAEEAVVGDAKNMCYFCQKCKNHGLLMWKKDHKRKCQYATCTCEQCDLIESRRRLDQHIKNNRKERKSSSQPPHRSPSLEIDLNNNSGSIIATKDDEKLRETASITPPKSTEDCRESAFMLYTQLKAKASISPRVLLPQAPAPPAAFSFLPYFLTTVPQPTTVLQPCLTPTDLTNWIQVQQRMHNFEMAL
ncbi:hypothetical protein QR680_004284 [Steinernema hermaphroditum]|uniref:DM domain-containing protein n=1 Tax=Steinernema hermaphroditum TaxID=289476 RepID=A0AA39LTQ8_9BILA|nr:hypothetical protein QR680_004284 [Steinernema hermaphroditum]